MKWEYLEENETVVEWFRIVKPRPNTKRNYLTSLQEYIEVTGLTPAQLIEEADRDVEARVLTRNRKMKRRLLDYREHLKGRGLAVNSWRLHLSAIKSFYKAFDHEIPNLGRDDKAIPKSEHIGIPTKEDIRESLRVCDARDKALILLGCSSGLSAADIVNLTVEQFTRGYDPKTEITTLFIRREKTETDFITFTSPEASRALHEYIEYRGRKTDRFSNKREKQLDKQKIYNGEGYLFIKKNVEDGYLEEHDEEMRKLDVKGLMRAYSLVADNAQKSAGKGVWDLIRSHNIRKFFNSTLKNAGCPTDIVEFLMGHDLGKTKNAYYRGDPVGLRKIYGDYMVHLIIQKPLDVATSPEYKKIEAENKVLVAETLKHMVERDELTEVKKEMRRMKMDRQFERCPIKITKTGVLDPSKYLDQIEWKDMEERIDEINIDVKMPETELAEYKAERKAEHERECKTWMQMTRRANPFTQMSP